MKPRQLSDAVASIAENIGKGFSVAALRFSKLNLFWAADSKLKVKLLELKKNCISALVTWH